MRQKRQQMNMTAGLRRELLVLGTFALLAASEASAQNPAGASNGDSPMVLAMAEAGQTLQVTIGHSKLLTADQPLGTIIVGDDTIAAATTGARNSVILTGLAAGSTNLIILDGVGEMLMSSQVTVVPVAGRLRSTVTIFKGATAREQHECRGRGCEPLPEDRATGEPLVLMAAPSQAPSQAPASPAPPAN